MNAGVTCSPTTSMSYLKDKSLLLKSDIYESDHCAIQKDESVCCGGQDF